MSHKEWRGFSSGPSPFASGPDSRFLFYNAFAASDVILRVLSTVWVMTSIVEVPTGFQHPPRMEFSIDSFAGDVGDPGPALAGAHPLLRCSPDLNPSPYAIVDDSIPLAPITIRAWVGTSGPAPLSAGGHRDLDGAIAGRHLSFCMGWSLEGTAPPEEQQENAWSWSHVSRVLILRTP